MKIGILILFQLSFINLFCQVKVVDSDSVEVNLTYQNDNIIMSVKNNSMDQIIYTSYRCLHANPFMCLHATPLEFPDSVNDINGIGISQICYNTTEPIKLIPYSFQESFMKIFSINEILAPFKDPNMSISKIEWVVFELRYCIKNVKDISDKSQLLTSNDFPEDKCKILNIECKIRQSP